MSSLLFGEWNTEGGRVELQWLMKPLTDLASRVQYPLATPSRLACRGNRTLKIPEIEWINSRNVTRSPDLEFLIREVCLCGVKANRRTPL